MADFGGSNRGAAPVIGILLMAALAVIFGALIGVFVFDVGSKVDSTGQAGVSFDQEPRSTNVSVTLVNKGNVRESSDIRVDGDGDCSGERAFSDVGDTVLITGCDPGDNVVVVATLRGDDTTIARYEVR